MSRKVRRTIYLDQEAYESMVRWADSLGISHSELVRDLVSQRPPGKGEPDADALTANRWWFSRNRKRQVRVAQFHSPDESWETPPTPAQRVSPQLMDVMGVGADEPFYLDPTTHVSYDWISSDRDST